jgi:hypothetical protein
MSASELNGDPPDDDDVSAASTASAMATEAAAEVGADGDDVVAVADSRSELPVVDDDGDDEPEYGYRSPMEPKDMS